MYALIRPLLFKLSPETAHEFTVHGLNFAHQLKLTSLLFGKMPLAPCTVMGLDFPNPIGLAAGMDKNAECIDGFGSLGFGFVEVGTVTPRPQNGNPKPRLFRLPEAQAIINRMGFNNHGTNRLLQRVQKRKYNGILGINIGKNADTPLENAVSDYLTSFQKVYSYADYVTINISSPNTANLRQLQHGEELDVLLNALKHVQAQLHKEHNKYVPLVVKISPDLSHNEVADIANKLLAHHIDGVIATNTTLSRKGAENLLHSNEKGGLSGAPLTTQSTEVVRQLKEVLQDKIPIIASGGVMTVEDVQAKLQAGANLVQIYTGLIYQGPYFVKQIVHSLASNN